MPENTNADKGLSEQQLDDLDVNRQRERLERSRPEHADKPGNPQQSDDKVSGRATP